MTKMCNCNNKDLEKEGCPLNGVCLTPNVIYGATVKILDMSGEPIEMTKKRPTQGCQSPLGKTGNMDTTQTSDIRG